MKLFYSPLACSLAVHVALREAELDFELVHVDTKTKKTKSGDDYLKTNPKGYVPALELDDGRVLTEAAAVLQYVADQAQASKLAPPAGSFERYRVQEWLNFVATELHKAFGPLFDPTISDEVKAATKARAEKWLDFVEHALAGREYLVSGGFTVADCYAYVVVNWTNFTGISLAQRPNLQRYMERIGQRPAVRAAIAAETGKS